MGIIENEVVVDFLYKVRHQGKAIWGGGVLNWRLMVRQTRTSECALLLIDRDKPRGTFVWLVNLMVGAFIHYWNRRHVDTQHWWYGVGIGHQILSVRFGRRLSPTPEIYNEWIHQPILRVRARSASDTPRRGIAREIGTITKIGFCSLSGFIVRYTRCKSRSASSYFWSNIPAARYITYRLYNLASIKII
jgi:hypothetical protein